MIDDRRGARWTIYMRAGDTYALRVVPEDENGNPVIVDTATTTLYRNRDTVETIPTTVNALTGVIDILFDATDSDDLGPGRYKWELRCTVNGEVFQWLTDEIVLMSPGSWQVHPLSQTVTLTVQPDVTIAATVLGIGPAGPAGPQGPPGPSDADLIDFVPCESLTETNVQDALCELADQIAPRIPTVKSSIYIENNATPTVLTQNVAAKVAGTFLPGPSCSNCTYTGNRITYNGTVNTRVMALASADLIGGNNQTYLIELRRNGLAVPGASAKIRHGSTIANGTLNAMIDLTPGQYVELWVTNLTASSDATIVDSTVVLMN